MPIIHLAEFIYGAVQRTLEHTVDSIFKESEFRAKASKLIEGIYPLSSKELSLFLKASLAENGMMSRRMRTKFKKSLPDDDFNKMLTDVLSIYQSVYAQQACKEDIKEGGNVSNDENQL